MRILRISGASNLIWLFVSGLLGATALQSAADNDSVYQRYDRKVVPSSLIREDQLDPFAPVGRWPARTKPATQRDVDEGKAVFTLAGLGEVRLAKLPKCPISGIWTTLKQFPQEHGEGNISYDNACHVIQAEQLRVNGEWRRYFGLVHSQGVAVAPAAEVDLWLPTDEADNIQWMNLPGGLDWGFKALGHFAAGFTRSGKLDATEPLPVEVYVRNRTAVVKAQPTDFYHGPDRGGPAWRKGVTLVVQRAPFAPRTPDANYPSNDDFKSLEPKLTTSFVAEDSGRLLETGAKVKVGAFDLRDWYDLREEGFYQCHFGFDEVEMKMPKSEYRGCVGASLGFTIGTPPPKLTVAELNKEIPPLGGKDVEEHIRKLIRETCEVPAADPAAGPEIVWSEPVGGLRSRIIHVTQGGYCGYGVLVGLKNVAPNSLLVPMGHPARPPQKGLFELQVRSGSAVWQTVEGFGGYRCGGQEGDLNRLRGNAERKEKIATKAVAGNPTVTLAPGQEAVVYVSGKEVPLLAKAAEVRIVLHQNAATAPNDGWQGTVATPPVAARRDEEMSGKLQGNLPFPAIYPDFDREGFMGGNMSGHEPAVGQLGIPNRPLMAALGRFDADGVRQEFERRMAAANDEPMKLLLASVAAGDGSQPAALYLLEMMRTTDYTTARNVFTVLARLVYHYDERQPAWLLAMVEAALSDERYATGLKEANWASDTRFTLSHVADENANLAWALGQVKCRQEVPFLIARVRKTKNRNPIMALGAMGDMRAVPVLIDIVKTIGKEAKYESGNGLSTENFSRAIEALADLKAADAVPVLVDYAEFPHVIEALDRIGDRRAVPVLRALVAADGGIIRDGKSLYPKAAAERLVKAKIALASMEDGDPVPRLGALLGDKSFGEFDRREVVWRLGDRADPRSIPLLIETIQTDPSGSVVNQAITVLAGFKYKAAVAGLIECFDADFKGKADWKRAYNPAMFQDQIAESLRSITGRSTGADKQQWREWWQNEGQAAADLKSDP